MLRDDSVSLREGEMYHGRYRILRCVDADCTGAAYEVVDMTTNAQQILKVVSSGTMAGTGIHVQSKNDRAVGENVAFLSETNFEQTAKSVDLPFDVVDDDFDANLPETNFEQTAKSVYSPFDVVNDDFDANAVTQICEPRAPKPSSPSTPAAPALRHPVPIPLPPPPPLMMRPDATMRAALPALPHPIAPLPPPLPPPEGLALGGAALASPNMRPRPLPPPTPPPERASRAVLALPPPTITPIVVPDIIAEAREMQQRLRPKIVTPMRFAIAAITLVMGGLAYFFMSRDEPKATTSQMAPTTVRTGQAPPPSSPPNATPAVNANGAETKAPMNGGPSEADRHDQKAAPPKTTPPKASKSPTDRGSPPATKRRRETLF